MSTSGICAICLHVIEMNLAAECELIFELSRFTHGHQSLSMRLHLDASP